MREPLSGFYWCPCSEDTPIDLITNVTGNETDGKSKLWVAIRTRISSNGDAFSLWQLSKRAYASHGKDIFSLPVESTDQEYKKGNKSPTPSKIKFWLKKKKNRKLGWTSKRPFSWHYTVFPKNFFVWVIKDPKVILNGRWLKRTFPF